MGSRFYADLASALGGGAYSSLASDALPVDWGPDHTQLLFSLNLRWEELHFAASTFLGLEKTQAVKVFRNAVCLQSGDQHSGWVTCPAAAKLQQLQG